MNHFIVVGAGILGASIGYHLAKTGFGVTIVDRQERGQSTDAAAGILCPWLALRRKPAWHRLARAGVRYYPTLIRNLEAEGQTETGYAQVGALFLNQDVGKLRWLERLARERRQDAPDMGDIILLSSHETRELFPPLDERYASLYIRGGARVDGRALRDALIQAARRHGASFIQGEVCLMHENRQVNGVTVNGQFYRGDTVFVTTGVWVNSVLASLGVTMRVRPKKGQILHLQSADADTDDWPVVRAPGGFYLLSFSAGRIVAGATHEDEAGFDIRATAGGMRELLTNMLTVAPGLKGSAWLETRAGLRPYTPGGMPVVGRLPGYEGVVIANGLGGTCKV